MLKYIINSLILEHKMLYEQCHVSYESDLFADFICAIVENIMVANFWKQSLVSLKEFDTKWSFIPLKHKPSEHPKSPTNRKPSEFMFLQTNGTKTGYPILVKFINNFGKSMATIEERSVKNNNLNTIKITINLYDINSADDIPELFNKVTHECTHGLDMYILSYNQYDKNKKSKVFIDKEKDGNIFDVYYKDEDWLFQFMYYMDPIELKILSSGLSKYLLKISRPPLNDKTGVYMKMNNQLRNDLLKYKSPREKVLAILDRQDIQNIVHLDVLRAMKDDFVLLNVSEKIPNQLDVDYDPTTDYEYLMSNYPKYRALIRILIVGYYLVNHNFFSLTELIQNSALKFLNNKQTVYKLIKNIKDISERDGFDKILKAITVKVNDLFMNYQEMIYNKALYAVQVFGL